MKRRLVEVELLEKGDNILLLGGKAIVLEEEKFLKPDDRFFAMIKIKWISNCRAILVGKKDVVRRKYCTLIKKNKK